MRRIALALGLLALLAPAPASAQDGLDATIRRTPHGVPHIEAKDYAGLGYGYRVTLRTGRTRVSVFALRLCPLAGKGMPSRYAPATRELVPAL